MAYENTIRRISHDLNSVFDELDSWFDREQDVRIFTPRDGGWSIDEVLEHVSLTSHFLLIVIRNGTAKALKRSEQQKTPEQGESNLEMVEVIGMRGSFTWARPDHMVPTGAQSSPEVRKTLQLQKEECQEILRKLSFGKGSLFTANMSVNKLGRLDLYQWIYFLVQHARRHIAQLQSVLNEFDAATKRS